MANPATRVSSSVPAAQIVSSGDADAVLSKEVEEQCHVCAQVVALFFAVISKEGVQKKFCSETCMKRFVISTKSPEMSKKAAIPKLSVVVDDERTGTNAAINARAKTPFRRSQTGI